MPDMVYATNTKHYIINVNYISTVLKKKPTNNKTLKMNHQKNLLKLKQQLPFFKVAIYSAGRH
jgi:hypothetical protein